MLRMVQMFVSHVASLGTGQAIAQILDRHGLESSCI